MLQSIPHSWRRLTLVFFLLLSLAGCAYGKHIDRGDEYYKNGQYTNALNEYQAALNLKPDSKEARNKVRQAKLKLTQRYTASARKKLQAGDYLGAITATADARDNAPNVKMVTSLINEVSTSVQAQAQTKTEAKSYAEAMQLLQALYDGLPSQQPSIEKQIEALKKTWSTSLITQGREAEKRKHEGDALLLYTKASTLVMIPEVVAKRDELRAKLLAQNPYVVRLKAKNSNKAYKVISQAIKPTTWPQNIRLASNIKASKPHATVMFKLGNSKITRSKQSTVRSAQYQSGTRQVPNPAYKRAQDNVLQEERRVLDRQKDVTRLEQNVQRYQQQVAREGDTPNRTTGAEQNLSNEQSRLTSARRNLQSQQEQLLRRKQELANVPQTIEEPIMATLSYPVDTHTVVASLPMDIEIVHADKREPLSMTKIIGVNASDSTHAAYPIARVAADPLNLPSPAFMLNQVYNSALKQTQKTMLQSLSSYRAGLLDAAKNVDNDGQRIHQYVIYLLLDPTQASPEVIAEINSKRGIPDAHKLLAK